MDSYVAERACSQAIINRGDLRVKSNNNDKTWMCVIFRINSDTSSDMNKNMISLQKTNSCLLENNTKMLGNDEAEVKNRMSRKYKEENIRSYLKRFSSLVALMPTLRAGFILLMYKETPRNKAESICCFCL